MGSENRLPHGTPNSNRSSSVSKKMVMTGLVSPILDLPQPNHYESLGAMVAMVAMSSKSLCLSLVYLLVKKWRTGFPYWIMLDYYNSQYMKGSLIPYNIYIYIYRLPSNQAFEHGSCGKTPHPDTDTDSVLVRDTRGFSLAISFLPQSHGHHGTIFCSSFVGYHGRIHQQ